MPLISVIMPIYNPGRFLPEAISSILRQTHSDLELIAVNDGSTDDSAAFLRDAGLRDCRLRALNIRHGGEARALNEGIAASKGEFVAFMDHDDIALSARLSVQLDWMVKRGVDVCGAHAQIFGAENKLLWFPETHEAILRELVFRMALIKNSVMMRAAIARNHCWDEHTPAYEYRMWLELARRYRLGNVPAVLMKYRRHPGQFMKKCSSQVLAGMNALRCGHFRFLYSDGDRRDYNVISRVVGRERMENADDLRLAGVWLSRLAGGDDDFLRERMARRWLGTCMNSAHLGMTCCRIYREILPEFKSPVPKCAWRLPVRCALKMAPQLRK